MSKKQPNGELQTQQQQKQKRNYKLSTSSDPHPCYVVAIEKHAGFAT